jgi:hypothetical protein
LSARGCLARQTRWRACGQLPNQGIRLRGSRCCGVIGSSGRVRGPAFSTRDSHRTLTGTVKPSVRPASPARGPDRPPRSRLDRRLQRVPRTKSHRDNWPTLQRQLGPPAGTCESCSIFALVRILNRHRWRTAMRMIRVRSSDSVKSNL